MTSKGQKWLDDAARLSAELDFLNEKLDLKIEAAVRWRISYIARSLELGIEPRYMLSLLWNPPGIPLRHVERMAAAVAELGLEAAIAAEVKLILAGDDDGYMVGPPI